MSDFNFLTPEILIRAYTQGYFPMAESRHDPNIYWFHPEKRGIIPLDEFHVPRSLKKLLREQRYEVRFDGAFEEVIRACAEPNQLRKDSWINDTIINLYIGLWELGFAHSVECWRDGELKGGLYGVSLGGAFFGESMFSRESGASKVALVHLVERLREAGYQLLDTQYINPHLLQFGAVEIRRDDYLALLEKALNTSPNPSARFLTASPMTS